MDRRAEYTDSRYNRSYQDKGWYAIKARHRADWRRVCANPAIHPDYVQRLIDESIGINKDDAEYAIECLLAGIAQLNIKFETRESGVNILTIGSNYYSMYFTKLYVGHNSLIFTNNLSGKYKNDYNISEMNATIKGFYELVGIAE